MANKELIEKVARNLAVVAWERAFKADANFMMHISPHKTPMSYQDDRWECYKDEAEAAISTILAAQNEHIEAEVDGYIENFRTQERIAPVHVTRELTELKRRLLNASALGEQSE